MTDNIRVGVDENTLVIVIRKVGDFRYEAFTEPHPITVGYGASGVEAVEDMVSLFHISFARLKQLERTNALPMSQQGTLVLMKQFSEFF